MTNPTSLVAKVLKVRYFPRSSVFYVSLGFNPIFIWRSIMASKDVVIKGSRLHIESGHQALIGKAPWLPNSDCGFITIDLHEELAMAPVCSLMMVNQRRWDYDVVTDLFNAKNRDLILKIPLITRRDRDVWYWLANPRGVFSVRSCYKMMTYDANNSSSSFWRRLWKLNVPGKVKNFLWRAVKNVLPTTDNLLSREFRCCLLALFVMPIISL